MIILNFKILPWVLDRLEKMIVGKGKARILTNTGVVRAITPVIPELLADIGSEVPAHKTNTFEAYVNGGPATRAILLQLSQVLTPRAFASLRISVYLRSIASGQIFQSRPYVRGHHIDADLHRFMERLSGRARSRSLVQSKSATNLMATNCLPPEFFRQGPVEFRFKSRALALEYLQSIATTSDFSPLLGTVPDALMIAGPVARVVETEEDELHRSVLNLSDILMDKYFFFAKNYGDHAHIDFSVAYNGMVRDDLPWPIWRAFALAIKDCSEVDFFECREDLEDSPSITGLFDRLAAEF